MTAMMNGLASGGPPVGPGEVFSLSDPSDLARLAKDASFVNVSITEWPMVFRAQSTDTHLEPVTSLVGPLVTAFAAAPEQLATMRRTGAELTSDYITSDGLALPGLALLVSEHA